MTKEKILDYFSCDKPSAQAIKMLQEFFNSNVVIPRGATLQAKFDGNWTDVFTNNDEDELRIKPSKPVYEYQWYSVVNGIATMPCKFYTEDEVDTVTFVKIKETKRVRLV